MRIKFKNVRRENPTRCARCKKDFQESQLRPLAKWLRIITVPFLLIQSYILVAEANSKYCRACARTMNATLFFVVFMIGFVAFLQIAKMLELRQ